MIVKKNAESKVEEYLIKLILNGKVSPGTYLKPERQLAIELGYTRPVIHKAIIRLESKGLVTIVPRQGVMVNDYRITGKLELLENLFDLNRQGIHPALNRSMLRFIHRNFQSLLIELASDKSNTLKFHQNPIESGEDIFNWMHGYAMSSKNVIYTMLFNEFKLGILNVGDAIVKADKQFLQQGRKSIDHAVESGHIDDIEVLLHQWFNTIEKLWLGGEKSE
ncbi:FadR/GntR family transcriptional regulator [Alkaliphilus serpentinus]|uniref:GntR family transcriptional regulator n=1 Tax=Alkaliphilus serpentinus TaxID=1482731 RepID=A0A833HPE5_9FIRM|nr:GntR family transcriptional regulator [Alkaliphilus serpentinus]KAB3530687.1 GntR family transcriptional regulator [Alkaliphilus serpentinus]